MQLFNVYETTPAARNAFVGHYSFEKEGTKRRRGKKLVKKHQTLQQAQSLCLAHNLPMFRHATE